jgi:hypothetical protein
MAVSAAQRIDRSMLVQMILSYLITTILSYNERKVAI